MLNDKVEFRITLRLWFYISYLLIVGSLVSNAILHYYELRPFAVALEIAFLFSYIFSIFLIQRKEE